MEQDTNKKKKKYVKPTITVTTIKLEENIAAGSATITVGGDPDFAPEVEDWFSQEEKIQDYL